MPSHTPFTLDRVVRLVIAICLFLGALWLINTLKAVLLPFCVACLLAYMCEPFVQYNRRLLHLKGRVVAIFVTLFELTFLSRCSAISLYLLLFRKWNRWVPCSTNTPPRSSA